jgi:dihydroorotase
MMVLIKNSQISPESGNLIYSDVLIVDDKIVKVEPNISASNADIVYDVGGAVVIPGAVDVHVHLREPGLESYKETIADGTRSAAKGGITSLMVMPNVKPPIDSLERLGALNEIIKRDAHVHVYPYASLTKNQEGKVPVDIEKLAPYVKGFSDDGLCVEDLKVLKECMIRTGKLDKVIASHAESSTAATSEAAELEAVVREIALVKETDCCYHFCHLSTEPAFRAVRYAQRAYFDITCEVTPHHMELHNEYVDDDPMYKMNPPLRSYENMLCSRAAIVRGVATIIASDHAPHTRQEKSLPFAVAPNGIIGLETLIPIFFSRFVDTKIFSINRFSEYITKNPAERFDIPYSQIEPGSVADIAVIDPLTRFTYSKFEILSKSSNSPFIGNDFRGRNILTLVSGKTKYINEDYVKCEKGKIPGDII